MYGHNVVFISGGVANSPSDAQVSALTFWAVRESMTGTANTLLCSLTAKKCACKECFYSNEKWFLDSAHPESEETPFTCRDAVTLKNS